MTKLANIDLLLPCEFRSFEELADLVVGWNPDFRQMSHARNMSMVFQTQTDSMIITRARFGCQVNQLGSTPSGMRTFAILNTPGRQLHFFGHSIEQDYLLVFPANNDLQSFSQAGFDVSTFSVPVDLLKEYLDTDEPTGCKNMLTAAESLFPLMPWQMKQFRMLLNRAAIVAVKQDSCSQAKINSVIQEEILSLLLDVLCGPSRYSVAASDRKLKDILEYIDLNSDGPILISELAEINQTSRRTIRNLFWNKLGTSPKTYINRGRLYKSHRDLWLAQSTNTHIADVANRWGFWHMGQFAHDYQNLFGELPSETLHRQRGRPVTPMSCSTRDWIFA